MFIQFALSTLLLGNIWKMNMLEILQRERKGMEEERGTCRSRSK
jgi:hypothetical protein